ncbi:TetR family transcriptional regulator C-terminal domain-containing protein [Pseudokineococcus sp. 1T1Z-3]|uniref:TetR family transcriptional regulator C-terminal domain-containing protein n=1 Tax=Pseudokineococcus sp. 1T1Z-3 TaxID=3132745 RepID=UPI00309F988F
MLIASAERMVDVVTARVRALPPVTGVGSALDVLAELMPLDALRRAELEVNIALVAEGAAEPALLPVRDDAHAGIAALCRAVVSTLAGEDADPDGRRARRLHALVDGLSLQLLHAGPEGGTDWAVLVLREELEAIAASADGPG